eukprot:2196953-Rhodomonas_salina.1
MPRTRRFSRDFGGGMEGNIAGDEWEAAEQERQLTGRQAQHKNKERVKTEASQLFEATNEFVRKAYMSKIQDVDGQVQNLMAEKRQVIAAKSRRQKEVLTREELPNLDDLEKDFHTIRRMWMVASQKDEALTGTMGPDKQKWLRNLDGILLKKTVLADKI